MKGLSSYYTTLKALPVVSRNAEKELLSKKGRLPEDIPPAADAVQFHIYRAIYQASYCWAQSLCKIPSLPDPCE